MLKTMAASADEKRASLIPKNSPVRRYMSSVYAMAGRMLSLLETTEYREKDILDKVHANGTRNRPIRPGIGNVAPVVGQSTADIMVHATEWVQGTITPPSRETVICIRGGSLFPLDGGGL
jgi:hypothetical protein